MLNYEQLLAAITERQEMQRIIDDASAVLDARTEEIKAYMTEAGKDEMSVGPFRIIWKENKPRIVADVDAMKADGIFDKYCKAQKAARPFKVA
jgi:hypothetical protein